MLFKQILVYGKAGVRRRRDDNKIFNLMYCCDEFNR